MKALKSFCQNSLVKIFAGFILLTITCFERSSQEVTDYPDPATKAGIDTGVYHSDWGAGFISMGNLALTPPDDPSPLPDFTGLSNSQALMAAASSHESGWHFFGGYENGFFCKDPLRFFRMAVSLPPYIPLQIFYDLNACGCHKEDVSFDDHLAEISVPILNIGAGGGSGITGDYTSSLTASSDLTNYLVSIPGSGPASDYGHADLWFGYDADELVWDVLRQWPVDHTTKTDNTILTRFSNY